MFLTKGEPPLEMRPTVRVSGVKSQIESEIRGIWRYPRRPSELVHNGTVTHTNRWRVMFLACVERCSAGSEHRCHALWRHSQRFRIGGPAGGGHRDLHQLRLVPGGKRAGASYALEQAQAAGDQ